MSLVLKTVQLPNTESTMALGARLGAVLRVGDIVLLRGGLGAGKTTFARGLIMALAGESDVPSPTYTLVQTYETPKFDIWHFDLYRLEVENDVWELGIEEAFDDGVCLIEWPERIASLLSGAELSVDIDLNGVGRTAKLSGDKTWEARIGKI